MLAVLFHCTEAEKEQQVRIHSQDPLAMPQTTSLMKNPCGVVHRNLFKLVTVSLRGRRGEKSIKHPELMS